jgi:VanZ family protein
MVAARIVAWLLTLTILVLSLGPASLLPETRIPREVGHFTIFAAMGFAFGLGYARRYAAIAIVMLIFAGAIETLQLFVPGRSALLTDFFLDTLALFYGVAGATSFAPANLRGTIDSSNPKAG